MRSPLLSLICFAVTVSSCKKYGLTSKTDLLTAGKWQITSHTEICYCGGSGFGTSTRDLYASYPACEKDNFYVFYNGGTAEVNEGATKCSAGNGQSNTEGWAFSSDESKIMFKGKTWNILQLNKTTFLISTVVLLGTGETITFTKF